MRAKAEQRNRVGLDNLRWIKISQAMGSIVLGVVKAVNTMQHGIHMGVRNLGAVRVTRHWSILHTWWMGHRFWQQQDMGRESERERQGEMEKERHGETEGITWTCLTSDIVHVYISQIIWKPLRIDDWTLISTLNYTGKIADLKRITPDKRLFSGWNSIQW